MTWNLDAKYSLLIGIMLNNLDKILKGKSRCIHKSRRNRHLYELSPNMFIFINLLRWRGNLVWKNKKNLIFYVFIELNNGYRPRQLTNWVKIDMYHKNGQNPPRFFKILQLCMYFTILMRFYKDLVYFWIMLWIWIDEGE